LNKFNRLAVFCGAQMGALSCYIETAKQFAAELIEKNISLVYGGSNIGLMKILADAMLEKKAEVIGVMPDFLVEKEIAHQKLSELYVVKSMHERKAIIYDKADGFVLLPGGMGSLDEFFEIITWAQLGLHNKPCGILNVQNYYDALIQFLDNAVTAGFVKKSMREMIIIEDTPKKLLAAFEIYQAPQQLRYMDKLKQT